MTNHREWLNQFFYRKEVWKTTWKFRFVLVVLLAGCLFLSKGFIEKELAESLVYRGPIEASDAAVIENFDPNYLLFEETRKLVKANQVDKVYVPANFNRNKTGPNAVSKGFVEVMSRISRVKDYELILVDEKEPIRLNTALQVKDHLQDKGVQSIIVVSSGFCSRRSFLIYRSVFESTGVKVSCLPVFSSRNTTNWTETWHGIQEVFLELGKLWYYELFVLD